MTFSNKVAIVAGGSSGIGLATALRLAEDGARVAICSHDAATREPALAQIHGEASRSRRTSPRRTTWPSWSRRP